MPSRKETSNLRAPSAKRLLTVLPALAGAVLVYLGFVIRGFDEGSCPTLGLNGVSAPCFHYFTGTDIPITIAGEMVIIIGAVLFVSAAASALYIQYSARAGK